MPYLFCTTTMGHGDRATERQRDESLVIRLGGAFEALFRVPDVGLVELAADGTFCAVNDAYCEMTGHTPHELYAMTVFDLSWPEDVEQHRARIGPFLRGETPPYHVEKRYRRKDGRQIWVEVFGAQIIDPKSSMGKTINIVHDISERKRTEEALRETLDRLELAKDTASLAIYDHDLVSNVITWDDRLRSLWGIAPGEPVTYDTLLAGLHSEDRERVLATIERVLDPAGTGRANMEFRIIHRTDGRERWIGGTGCARFLDGRAVRVVGTALDITDRKQAEAALHDSEERFRTLVEPFCQAVWDSPAEGQQVDEQPSWREYTGQSFEEMRGQGWAQAVHPDDRQDAVRLWDHSVRNGTPLNAEFRLRAAEGGWRWTSVHAAPLRNADGTVRRWVGMNVDVSDRKQAEIALRESEARYRTLFEAIDEGYLLVDVILDEVSRRPRSLYCVTINPAATRLLGRDFAGHTVADPDSPFLNWLDALGDVSASGQTFRNEFHVDRSNLWVEVRACRVDQETNRIAIVLKDVTERRTALERERAIAARDAFRIRLADSLRSLADPKEIQAVAARTLGHHLCVARVAYRDSEREAAYRDSQQGVAYRDSEREVAVLQQVEYAEGVSSSPDRCDSLDCGPALLASLRAGRSVTVDDIETAPLTEADRAAYRQLSVGAHISVPLMKDGRFKAFLSVQQPTPRKWTPDDLALVEEVAERTWAATEKARAERALEEKDRRLRAALAAARMGTWQWDVRHDWQTVDESLQEILGTPSAGPLDTFLCRIDSEERAVVRAAITRSLEQGASLDVEFRIRDDGHVRWLKGRGDLVRDADGSPVYLTGACVDITERKAMEEELRLAAHRKDEFLAMLSHELRNPLAPIRNSVYVLERAPAGSERATRAREVIDRQARHMTHLIDDLLDVTRISRGKIRLQREHVDLAEIVHKTAEDHREIFAKSEIELVVEGAESPIYADADPTRLAQMIGNLLGNSAKFTSAHGRTTLSVGVAEGSALIRVRDNGIGISPETLPHLFEPFVQADRGIGRNQGGLGLGLALVRGLAELHGGRTEARSEGMGKGAEFSIHLPLERTASSTTAPEASPPASDSRVAQLRVLVIEDNVDAANSLRDVLDAEGHVVEVAYDGGGGLTAARKFRPDVVFCDLGLPGLDGLAVARAIRADPALGRVALFALSGYTMNEDVARAIEAGFQGHLAKPPTIAAIERALVSSHPQGNVTSSPAP